MLDFAQNFNVYTVPGLEKLVKDNSNFIFRYPDFKHTGLKAVIADKFGVDPAAVAIGNGATEIIFTLPAVLQKTDVVVCSPTFWEYTEANKNGKNIIDYLTKESAGFHLDFSALESLLPSAGTVYLCNPNNPTSVLTKKADLLSFIQNHPRIDFIVDESYLIFRPDYQQQSLVPEAEKLTNLYVVTSLSKMFFAPGLRFGFMVAHPDNIARYYRQAIPYLINPLAENCVPYLLEQESYIKKTRAFYTSQRTIMYEQFNQELSGVIKAFEPAASFILLKILSDLTSTAVVEKLKSLGVIVRDGAEFKGLGQSWIRAGIRTPKENSLLLSALRKVL